jgi:hypothetical protein
MTTGDLHNNGDGAFYDVTSSALRAGGNLPKIKVDGPFGAPAEDVFKAEGASFALLLFLLFFSCADQSGRIQSPSSSVPVSASLLSPRSFATSGASSSLPLLFLLVPLPSHLY